MSKSRNVRSDCKWFKGHVPCLPHKQNGQVCTTCTSYEGLLKRVLIIKLGAAGDVIRTTPLLRRLRHECPQFEITWLTYFPDLVPKSYVNKVLSLSLENTIWLNTQKFDWLINLDKDDVAIALGASIKAARKSGFGMDKFGKCMPFGTKAEQSKWMTGLWDDLNRSNKKNYMEELLQSKFKFIITSVTSAGLDETWLGREITRENLGQLVGLSSKYGFNLTFEGGEAETFVIDCPLFYSPIRIMKANKFWDGYRGRFEITEAVLEK